MIIKCKMCGGDLHPVDNATTCECEFCGTVQTIPNVDNEKKSNLFNRANRLRMNNEFDKASAVYESIVAEFPEEAEAYWGLCLCAYGIEYVDDPATGKKMPTCHRTLTTSIMEDANFEQACDYADVIARKVYREEAKEIDRIQKNILDIAANEAPYDVFICYKETDENGNRTEDSVLAQEVYDELTAKGMKVFFSRITLEDKLGVQYEPYIYAALSSAKVMLAFGTQFEYYDAVWVKNEWRRFLDMMRTDKRKALIPCFKNLDAYDMPKEFKGLQAQDMNKLGWMQDLIRGVEKLCGGTSSASEVAATSIKQASATNSTVENLMKRARIFLEDGDFGNANAYFEKVLDIDAEYAPAYVGKLCAKLKLHREADLGNLEEFTVFNTEWEKALRYANDAQKQLYLSYIEQAQDGQRRRLDKLHVYVQMLQNDVQTQNEKISMLQKEETQLETELSQTRGIFSSRRKNDLQFQINNKKSEINRAQRELRKKQDIAGAGQRQFEASQAKVEEDKKILQKRLSTLDSAYADFSQEKIESLRRELALSVGDTVKFGVYPQKVSHTDRTPIEWQVLACDDDKTLLISSYGLSAQPYNEKCMNIMWEKCTLRTWLNTDFYNKAFSADDKQHIIKSNVTADPNPSYSTDPGNATTDNVFLLSIDEVNKYFASDEDRICYPTDYAEKQGVYTSDSGACWWWLRSPGGDCSSAANVGGDGSVDDSGDYVDLSRDSVRPAVWVRLSAFEV